MTAAGHIAAGLIIDQHCPPDLALWAGIASHAAMDMLLPEYRPWPPGDNIAIIAWEAVASYVLLREAYKREERAGVLGQLAPDIVDGVYSLLNPAAWQTGKLLCPWHRAGAEIWKRDMSWASTFAVEALLMWWALR
jgi:hypothetical protein